jgi:hypothetical protein
MQGLVMRQWVTGGVCDDLKLVAVKNGQFGIFDDFGVVTSEVQNDHWDREKWSI